jgi:hypothetical protein
MPNALRLASSAELVAVSASFACCSMPQAADTNNHRPEVTRSILDIADLLEIEK